MIETPSHSVDAPFEIEGYLRIDGWWVAADEQEKLAWYLAHAPPRPYGVLEQLRTDLKARPSQILYAVLLSLVVGGIVMSDWWMLGSAGAGVLFFGRGFLDAIRVARHGVMSTATIRRIQHDYGIGGTNEGVEVDGRPMNVGYSLEPVREILDRGRAVELRVVYAPKQRKPVAHAIGYRASNEPASPPAAEPR